MESYDPSAYRRRKEFLSSCEQLTVSGSNSSSVMSLSRFTQLMSQIEIDGPYDLDSYHLGDVYLGSGAQFDVFGTRHLALSSFPTFDQPYLEFIPRARNMVWASVAVKRARFTLAVRDSYTPESGSQSSSLKVGFGTPSQLRAFELEVLALCHGSIRNHRNIVKLLAWGFAMPTERRKVEPLSPVLILEHGNCSLRVFLANGEGTIPNQVLQKLALDTVQGLSILHASGIVHGDLKTDNVLVFPEKEGPFFCIAKLSDFGLSVSGQSETERIYNLGTPGWQAPEFLGDNGVSTDMLVKSDYYSLGLLILSIMLTHGAPPLKFNNGHLALEFAKGNLSKSALPSSASDRIRSILEDLLQPNPHDRVSDLENVCRLLEQTDWESFDSHGAWVNNRFNDTTPWGEIPPSLGSIPILGALSRRASERKRIYPGFPGWRVEKEGFVIYSWLEIHKFLFELQGPTGNYPKYLKIVSHYIDGIEEVIFDQARDRNFSMDVVGQEISGHELLGMTFSCHGFPSHTLDRFPYMNPTSIIEHREYRRSRGSCAAIAAAKGYFPAQAVAAQILKNTNSRLLWTVLSKTEVWQWNAVSTGYILAWEFAHEYPEENALALQHFRMFGGYNTHYIYMETSLCVGHDTSGLLRNPLGWLSAYPLHYAAALGNVTEVEYLVARGCEVNSLDASGETPLQRACMAGASSSVRFLIRHGADPTIKSKILGTIPLHWLFVFEPKEVYEAAILLTGGTKSVLNEVSGGKVGAFHFPFRWPAGTPLEWAVLSNRYEAVNVLLELGSTLDSISDFFPGPTIWGNDTDGITFANDSVEVPFHAWIYGPAIQFRLPVVQTSGIYRKQLETLTVWKHQWSSKAALNLHLRAYYGSSIIAAVAEDDFNAVKRLVEAGRDVNIRDHKSGKTSLITAIRQNNRDIVRLLLDNGARLDEAPIHHPLDVEENSIYHPNQASPLQHAANLGNLEIVRLLLERGADVNAARSSWASAAFGENLASALGEATYKVDKPMVEVLLKYGADLELQNKSGRADGTALYIASSRGSLELVELFLERGANPNTLCMFGTALHGAAKAKSVKIVRALLDRGADPNIQGPKGTTIQLAASPGGSIAIILELIELLLARGADVTMSSRNGGALEAAASTGSDIVVKRLLDAGAPVNGGLYRTALQEAISITENVGLVKLLLNHGADPDLGSDGGALELAVRCGDERQVELLLRRGANPNAQGGFFGSVLKRAQSPKTKATWLAGQELDGMATRSDTEASRKGEKYGSAKITQMLLDWGAQDETEPGRWHLMVDELAKSPQSLSDVCCARFLLGRCFKRYARWPCEPSNLMYLSNRVLSSARYWPAELSERQDKIKVSKDAPDVPYLEVKIKTWPSPNARVCRVIFRIKTRDEEAIKRPEINRSGPFNHSNTWFETRIQPSSPTNLSQPRLIIQKNFRGSVKTRTHHIVWDADSDEPKISGFVTSLRSGAVVEVFAKTSTDLYPNYVDSMEIIVCYSHVGSSSYLVRHETSRELHGPEF